MEEKRQQKSKEQDVHRAVELTQKMIKGEISREQFDQEMAYWSLLNFFDDIKYVEFPAPPAEMIQYWQLPDANRETISREFFQNEPVKSFIDKKNYAINSNKKSIELLNDIYEKLPESDEENRQRVKERLDSISNRYNEDITHMAEMRESDII